MRPLAPGSSSRSPVRSGGRGPRAHLPTLAQLFRYRHPFPGCLNLRSQEGRRRWRSGSSPAVAGRALVAAPWTPPRLRGRGRGRAPGLVWAVLDCPTIMALVFQSTPDATERVVTGRLAGDPISGPRRRASRRHGVERGAGVPSSRGARSSRRTGRRWRSPSTPSCPRAGACRSGWPTGEREGRACCVRYHRRAAPRARRETRGFGIWASNPASPRRCPFVLGLRVPGERDRPSRAERVIGPGHERRRTRSCPAGRCRTAPRQAWPRAALDPGRRRAST